MAFKKELERGYGIKKLMDKLCPIENTSESEDESEDPTSYSNVDYLFGVKDIRNFIFDETFLVRDNNGNIYSIYFDIENQIFEIDIDFSFLFYFDIENLIFEIDDDHSFLSELESSFSSFYNSSYMNNGPTPKYAHLWVQCENEKCYALHYKKFFLSQMNICDKCGYHLKMSSSERIEVSIDPGTWDPMDEDMVSLDPIDWGAEEYEEKTDGDPMDEDIVSLDPIALPSEEDEEETAEDETHEEEIHEEETDEDETYEAYKDRIDSYENKTGLAEAVQTGVGQLNGIPVAFGVMDFLFVGGSMGSVVGEKITRLIKYATTQFLPLIIVCTSGGARMQEGAFSLMQMAKISSALYDYKSNKKLLYISILTSPTTGGVTASFGMLGDIIIAEPNSYIAFTGQKVIEQTLNVTLPEGSQTAEYLFDKGLFNQIVPRNVLKSVLVELLKLHPHLSESK
uniref:acetyl-CoA carboxylase beta subunit n=1 Tax=Schnabelia nepetifolia TaxID=201516 RepID=UPI0030FF02EB